MLQVSFSGVAWPHLHIWIRKNQMQTVTAATCMWWSVLEECRWPVAHWTCWLHWGAVTVECSVWAQNDGNHGSTCTACRIQVRELGPYRSLDASMHFTAVTHCIYIMSTWITLSSLKKYSEKQKLLQDRQILYKVVHFTQHSWQALYTCLVNWSWISPTTEMRRIVFCSHQVKCCNTAAVILVCCHLIRVRQKGGRRETRRKVDRRIHRVYIRCVCARVCECVSMCVCWGVYTELYWEIQLLWPSQSNWHKSCTIIN